MIYTLTLNPAIDRELTVPEIAFDRVLRAKAMRTDFGGKGFNVSRALLALGTESVAVGFVGGATGEKLVAGLAELGIRTDFVPVKGETRTNISVVADDHMHYLKVNEPGPVVSEDECSTMMVKIGSLVKAGDWWIVAGSSPPGIPPRFYADIIGMVQSAGANAILDAEGAALRAGCGSHAFLVKPNAVEACELTGDSITSLGDAIKTFPKIHALGPQRAVISMGRLGAAYSDGEHSWWAESPKIEERNPIGAGDAMVAGLVWSLSRNREGPELLRWAVACGAAAASLEGTAMGSLPLIESLAARVRLGEAGTRPARGPASPK